MNIPQKNEKTQREVSRKNCFASNVRHNQQLLLGSQEFARALNPFGSSSQKRVKYVPRCSCLRKKTGQGFFIFIFLLRMFLQSLWLFLRICIFMYNLDLTVY